MQDKVDKARIRELEGDVKEALNIANEACQHLSWLKWVGISVGGLGAVGGGLKWVWEQYKK